MLKVLGLKLNLIFNRFEFYVIFVSNNLNVYEKWLVNLLRYIWLLFRGGFKFIFKMEKIKDFRNIMFEYVLFYIGGSFFFLFGY